LLQDVLKKKSSTVFASSVIIKSIKDKARSYRGYQDLHLKAKIALVWMRSSSTIVSVLVDESELEEVLRSSTPQVLAVQVIFIVYLNYMEVIYLLRFTLEVGP